MKLKNRTLHGKQKSCQSSTPEDQNKKYVTGNKLFWAKAK